MKKCVKAIACGVLCTLMLTGCGQTEAPAQPAETTITETTAAAVVMIEINTESIKTGSSGLRYFPSFLKSLPLLIQLIQGTPGADSVRPHLGQMERCFS